MDGDTAAFKNVRRSLCAPKVHDALCGELMKVSDKIISILPAIESAHPGASSGIQVLCFLNNTIEKTKLLTCYCAESSKLYLAITAESIKSRCQRILTYFNQSLHQIMSMVPLLLASKISEVLDHLRAVKFIIDPGEDEAGKALLNLLAQSDSTEDQEIQVLQFVALKLNITSAIALLVERRSIKKLLDKFHNVDDKKEKILKYFLYLIKKYGNLIQLKPDSYEYKENTQSKESSLHLWQSSHNNSVSSLKNVSTALLDGTKRDFFHEKLSFDDNLFTDSDRTSIAIHRGASCPTDPSLWVHSSCCSSRKSPGVSDSSPITDQLFSWSDDYRKYPSFSDFNQEMYLNFLFELSRLPALLHEEAMEQMKRILEGDEVIVSGMISNGFAEALVLFLMESHVRFDIPAQRCGAHIFLGLMNHKRWEFTSLYEQSFQIISSFLNFSINTEALTILQKLIIHHPDHISHISASTIPIDLIHYLYSGENQYTEIVLNILSDLSFHGEMRSFFMSSTFIEKLGELLCDMRLVKLCLNILHNLFGDEEDVDDFSTVIAGAEGFVTSIAEVVEDGDEEEQEQAVTILLVLCSCSLSNCLMVLKEGVISSLVDISVNGKGKGKESSLKLLHVLSGIRHNVCFDNNQPSLPEPESESESDFVEDSLENSRKFQPRWKCCFGFFSKKMRFLTKFCLCACIFNKPGTSTLPLSSPNSRIEK